MESGTEEIHRGVEVVTSAELEDFTVRLGESVAKWSSPFGPPPKVAFSHTATEDGFSYAAIVIGEGSPATKVETRLLERGD